MPVLSRNFAQRTLSAVHLAVFGLGALSERPSEARTFHLWPPAFGIDSLFEHQESLRISSAGGTVTLSDASGQELSTGPLEGGPLLLGRKFDLEWELRGAGIELPFELADFRLGPGGKGKAILAPQVLAADFDLRFHNRREPETNTILRGSGSMFGVELKVAANLCRECPWRADSIYRYQLLPRTSVSRGEAVTIPQSQILTDETHLRRETHDLLTRAGYSFSANQTYAYLGVLSRWMDIDIDDELSSFSAFLQQRTTLKSHTKLESRATQALVGVEARLSRSLVGRSEVSFGDGDTLAVLKVAYVPQKDHGAVRRMRDIAKAIAPDLERIVAEFRRAWEGLEVRPGPSGAPAYFKADVEDLLNRTERELKSVLDRYTELIALEVWVDYTFRQVYEKLQIRLPQQVRAAFASLSPFRVQAQRSSAYIDWALASGVVAELASSLVSVATMFKTKEPMIEITFKSNADNLRLLMHPGYIEEGPPPQNLGNGGSARIMRGLYSYVVYQEGKEFAKCDIKNFGLQGTRCPLDLILNPLPVLYCEKKSHSCEQRKDHE